ncbi:MAG: hypothetical protein WAK91_09155, partial [Candidatus Acidiferrales bacterium]
MSSSRRTFLQSLSRSALVLSFENILALAKPSRWRGFAGFPDARDAEQSSPTPGSDIGVSFVNV